MEPGLPADPNKAEHEFELSELRISNATDMNTLGITAELKMILLEGAKKFERIKQLSLPGSL